MAASVLEPRPSAAAALSGSGVTGSRQHFGQAGLRLVERGRLVVLCFTLLWVSLAWRQGSGMHRGRYTARWAWLPRGLLREAWPLLSRPWDQSHRRVVSAVRARLRGVDIHCAFLFESLQWVLYDFRPRGKEFPLFQCALLRPPRPPGVTNLATLSCCSEYWGELV